MQILPFCITKWHTAIKWSQAGFPLWGYNKMTRLFLDALSPGKIRGHYSRQVGWYFDSLNQKDIEISATSQNGLTISVFTLRKMTIFRYYLPSLQRSAEVGFLNGPNCSRSIKYQFPFTLHLYLPDEFISLAECIRKIFFLDMLMLSALLHFLILLSWRVWRHFLPSLFCIQLVLLYKVILITHHG